jgi:cytochrome c-type protein NapB
MLPTTSTRSPSRKTSAGCHSLEKFKEKKAPKIGVSHLDSSKKAVTMDRYQCNSCHVPQVDAKPLVDNTFVGNLPPKKK